MKLKTDNCFENRFPPEDDEVQNHLFYQREIIFASLNILHYFFNYV